MDTFASHKLKVPEKVNFPCEMVFFDTETYVSKRESNREYHRFRLGVALYKRIRNDTQTDTKKYLYFTDKSTFWDFISQYCKNKTTLFLFAHNIVFDLISVDFILELEKRSFTCEYIYDNGYTFIAKWKRGKARLVALNTANWFMGTLDSWGKIVGLEKLDMPDFNESNETWFTYCKRDVDVLDELMSWYVKFIKNNNLGSWKYTIASSAFYAYRFRFMNHSIYIPQHSESNSLARESYHGGRTEVFRIGEYSSDTYYKLDVNSMYPFCMSSYKFPVELQQYGEISSLEQLDYLLKRFSVIARVKLDTDIPYYGVKHDDRLIFPIGKFWSVLTTPELITALKHNHIIDTDIAAVYRTENIFFDYVQFFYKLKQEYTTSDTKVLRAFSKLYLNSLYGKFGQRGYHTEILGHTEYPDYKMFFGYDVAENVRYKIMQIGRTLLYSYIQGESKQSFCAIASHVTAYARIYLYNLIRQAGLENVFYCDTDSVIVNTQGYLKLKHMINETTLGALKIEDIADNIAVYAPKDYRFGEHVILKGIRKEAKEIEPLTFQQEQWPGLSTIYKDNNRDYFVQTIIKRVSREIKTGIVLPNGFVEPIQLGMQ